MGAEVAAGAMVLGGAMQVIGTLKQGEAAKQAGDYNAAVANNNAIATQYEEQSALQAENMKSEAVLGNMKAQFGASGVADSGSAMDAIKSSAQMAALNSMNTAYSYEQKARGYQTSAVMDAFEGENAQANSKLSAVGSLLSTAGSAYSLYNRVRAPGKTITGSNIDIDPTTTQDALGSYNYGAPQQPGPTRTFGLNLYGDD